MSLTVFLLLWLVAVAGTVGGIVIRAIIRERSAGIFEDEPDWLTVVRIICAFLLIFAAVSTLVSWDMHAQDLGTVRMQSAVIEVGEQRVAAIKEDLMGVRGNLPENPALLFNADSPVRSMIEALAVAEKDLAIARTEKALAQRQIARRELGISKWVVQWLGKE